MDKRVEELLGKFDRTEEDFEELLLNASTQYTLANCKCDPKQYIDEYHANQTLSYDIGVTKTKKVEQVVEVSKLPDDETLKQMMGEDEMEAYKKKFETLKTANTRIATKMASVDQEVPVKIYMDLNTGLYKAEAEIYKNFLYGTDKLYSFGKIAAFLGLELNVKEIKVGQRKDIYLCFIKSYSDMEYININHFFDEPKTESDKQIYNSKKLLIMEQVKRDIELGVNKIIEFSNIVEDIVKQLKTGGI